MVTSNGKPDQVLAFDCGPGNMLIDTASQQLFHVPFDADGQRAARGNVDTILLNRLKQLDTFTALKPPKSTGRELYGTKFWASLGIPKKLSAQQKLDILHTITLYTAHSIYSNYKQFIRPQHSADVVAVGGGGAHNSFLMQLLEKKFIPAIVKPVSAFGLDETFKEAIGFAVLANETIQHQPSNLPQTTGAARPAILGKYCPV